MSKKKKKASRGKRIELVLKSDRDNDIEEFLSNQRTLGKSPTIRTALRLIIAEYGKDDLLKAMVDMKLPAKDSKAKNSALARDIINHKKNKAPQKQTKIDRKKNTGDAERHKLPPKSPWGEEDDFDNI